MDLRKSFPLGLGIVLGIGLLFLALAGTALAQGMMPPGGGPMPGMPGGMMGPGYGYPGGPGMMAGQGYTDTVPFAPGFGYGMMGPGMGMMGMGPGMMGFGMMGMMGMGEPELLGLPVLSIPEAREAVAGYLERLAALGLPAEAFTIGEVMVFDNQAYVQVLEKETGRGAFELLVEPRTRWVMPEPGPNMMWNLKYSPMARMMGWSFGLESPPAEMPLGEEEALRIAQTYAAQVLNGAQVASELTPFYGYYTVDVLRDGKPVGMLSVNGYTGQVFVHHWHGDFVAMGEAEE